jgi:hypothetical protein
MYLKCHSRIKDGKEHHYYSIAEKVPCAGGRRVERHVFYLGEVYRDDHELLRNLTRADGVLVESDEQVQAYLLPTVNYPPALEKIVRGLLTEINDQDPKMPDGSGRRLRLKLGEKTGLQIAIAP